MKTIVVVDDDQVFCRLIRTVFELEGYQVMIVPDPGDVVPTVRQTEPALLLMDVHSGSGDTVGLLQELRADQAGETLPIVMTSGMDRSAECLAAGADDFILKPFRPAELLAMVEGMIEG